MPPGSSFLIHQNRLYLHNSSKGIEQLYTWNSEPVNLVKVLCQHRLPDMELVMSWLGHRWAGGTQRSLGARLRQG